MLIDQISIYLDDNNFASHWEAYPFTEKHQWCSWNRDIFLKLLIDRGIKFVKKPQNADIIITTCKNQAPFIDNDIPTILIEGRDYMTILNSTKKILNDHKNIKLWKWGILNNFADYSLSEYSFTAVIDKYYEQLRASEEFCQNQLMLGYNLFWHPYHSRHSFIECKKLIDVSFVGTVDQYASTWYKTMHRQRCITSLDNFKGNKVIINGSISQADYCRILSLSKICISPYGNSEICGRDGQGLSHDCVVIRPKTREFASTWPDVWSESVECERDFSDLDTIIEKSLDEWDIATVRERGIKWRSTYDSKEILADRVIELLHASI